MEPNTNRPTLEQLLPNIFSNQLVAVHAGHSETLSHRDYPMIALGAARDLCQAKELQKHYGYFPVTIGVHPEGQVNLHCAALALYIDLD